MYKWCRLFINHYAERSFFTLLYLFIGHISSSIYREMAYKIRRLYKSKRPSESLLSTTRKCCCNEIKTTLWKQIRKHTCTAFQSETLTSLHTSISTISTKSLNSLTTLRSFSYKVLSKIKEKGTGAKINSKMKEKTTKSNVRCHREE